MTKNKLFFISDVHIGTNAPSNWYQDSVHGPFLETALTYIRAQKESVRELILLGDLFDQWMDPPEAMPPDFQAIIKANPRIFGGMFNGQQVPGALMELLDALEGNVAYMNGNHDMYITPADIATLKSPGGLIPRVIKNIFYEPEGCNNRLLCTHGHPYSMFSAPDLASYPKGFPGLPLGYFVTRLSTLWSMEHFNSKQPNIADMKGGGNPHGLNFIDKAMEGITQAVVKGEGDLADLMISAFQDATRKKTLYFLMPDGTKVTIPDLLTIYKGLFTQYPRSTDIPARYFLKNDTETRLAALGECDILNTLASFGRNLAKEYRVVVMGHTHVPINKIERYIFPCRKSLYSNSGFNCPSVPDMQDPNHPKFPTFTEVVVDSDNRQFSVSVYKVVKEGEQYKVELAQGPNRASMK
jgi:UDP-2,3-diacylglucosamine pyrophosphatase LpxH